MAKILTNRGPRRSDCLISFLIVGPGDFGYKITEGLHQGAKERNWHISVHQCEFISQVIQSNTDFGIDFIIFTFDWRLSQSASEVETNINLIDEQYILSGAACLVNCTGISNVMGLTSHISAKIQEKYNIRLLCANIFKQESCTHLSNRILNLAEAVLGITSGIPTSTIIIHNTNIDNIDIANAKE